MKQEQIKQVMTEVLEELKILHAKKEKEKWIMDQIRESMLSVNEKKSAHQIHW
jgi:hypothetical protein